jgi:hypothetical protein
MRALTVNYESMDDVMPSATLHEDILLEGISTQGRITLGFEEKQTQSLIVRVAGQVYLIPLMDVLLQLMHQEFGDDKHEHN